MANNVEGLDELLNNLTLLGGNVKETCVKALHRGAKKIQKNAKYLAPVSAHGGHLRNSIKTKAEGKNNGAIAKVFTNLEYAPYVEFGTGQRGRESNIDRPERNIL